MKSSSMDPEGSTVEANSIVVPTQSGSAEQSTTSYPGTELTSVYAVKDAP